MVRSKFQYQNRQPKRRSASRIFSPVPPGKSAWFTGGKAETLHSRGIEPVWQPVMSWECELVDLSGCPPCTEVMNVLKRSLITFIVQSLPREHSRRESRSISRPSGVPRSWPPCPVPLNAGQEFKKRKPNKSLWKIEAREDKSSTHCSKSQSVSLFP